MGLVDKIKADARKSGQNKGKFIYFREGQKQRVRFLTDMDDGMEVVFHDSFEAGINVPCQEVYGRDCPYCEDETLRTRSQYVWSVYNYESNEVQLFMFPVNNCSPIPALMAMYENYGTIIDRDYVISVSGKQQNKTYSVVPMDKAKFRNTKVKPFADKTILKMIDKAFPCEDVDDEEDEEEAPKTKRKPAKANESKKTKAKTKPEEEYEEDADDYDDGEEWGEEEEETPDYSEMSAKDLYALCKERSIEATPRKPAKYYIKLLEDYDKAQDDWDDDEEWEDE